LIFQINGLALIVCSHSMLGSMPTTLIMKAMIFWQMSRGRRMPRRWVGSKTTWTSWLSCCCCCCYSCCCCCSEGIGVHEKKRKTT